jgi:RimJ/RimL family protein N-acetyltransferase
MQQVSIRLAEASDLKLFFNYLDKHLRENGKGETAKFQPISSEQSKLNDILRSKFTDGISADYSENGWRRLMIASCGNEIVGHIDIRGYAELASHHRTQLGMGVDSRYRGQGIASRLLEYLINWMALNSDFEYLDLNVIGGNEAAFNLYKKHGFVLIGELKDRFRLDGKSYSDRIMSLSLNR